MKLGNGVSVEEGKRRKWVKAVIAAVVLALVVLAVVRVASNKVQQVVPQEKLQPVAVTAVVSRPFGEQLSVAGTVTAFTEAKVSSRVAGRVVAVNATVGQKVTEGQTLLTIDRADYQIALKMAEAGLATAKANSIQAETGYDNAKINYQRTEELFNQGAASKSQLEAANGALAIAESAYKANQALILQCGAALDKARADYEGTEVKAPFSGVVAKRMTDIGEMVSPQSPVFVLIQDEPLLVGVNLPESMVAQVAIGQNVDIYVEATGKTYRGTVTSVAPQADQSTKCFAAEVKLEKVGREVRPGMVAELRLSTKQVANALVVPTDALLDEDNGAGIYVVENNVAHHRKVVTGMAGQGYTQVVSGLKAGEMVVVRGNHLLVDGMGVKVETAENDSPAQPGGESN